MMRFRKFLLQSRLGQAMTEYIIIVAIISVATVGLCIVFRKQINNFFTYTLKRLKGESAKIKKESYSSQVQDSPFTSGGGGSSVDNVVDIGKDIIDIINK